MDKTLNYLKQKAIKLFSQPQKIDEDYIPNWFETYMFYFSYIKINWFLVLFNNLKTILQSYMSVRNPFLLLDIKNALLDMDDQKLFKSVIEFIAYKVITKIIFVIDQNLQRQSYSQVEQKIQLQMLEHIFSMDISYFENNKACEITELIQSSSGQISSDVLYNSFVQDISIYLYYGGQLYFIFAMSPKIFISMLIVSLIGAYIQERLNEKIRQENKKQEKENKFKRFVLSDILNNIFLIKTFGTEKKEIDLMNKINAKSAEVTKKENYYLEMVNLTSSIVSQALSIVTLVQVFMMKVEFPQNSKDIAVGLAEMMSYSYAVIHLSNQFVKFIKKKPEAQNNSSAKCIGKIINLFNQKPKIPQDFDEANDHSQLQGNIRFENVFFRYPKTRDTLSLMNQKLHEGDKAKTIDSSDKLDSSKDNSSNKNEPSLNSSNELLLTKQESERDYVLKDISFDIKSGQFVAFVGMSGSGKSTIVKMIQRFYDVDSGFVLFDNQNLRDIPMSKLRRSIGIVSQEPTLFDNDIEYNITYGCHNGEYTQEELRHICDVSGVSEFVFDEQRFPQGLKTLVGTKGIKLSGGQKQRVAIARALIKKPSILILDEATSSLDAESEHIVQKYIDQLVEKRGMTIIVVAHRLSTIIKSDLIYVMEQGQIKETGRHSQLLENDGIYKKLIHHQINFQDIIENS